MKNTLIQQINTEIPRLSLAQVPSPVRSLTNASAAANARIFVKHDGLNSRQYAGNKVRKLEFLLADAVSKNASHIVTLGSAGSNHAVATSTYAHQLGLQCSVLMTPQPTSEVVQQNLLRHIRLGTNLELFERYGLAERAAQQLDQLDHSYLIPLGGSSALGTAGHILAAAELASQVDAGELPLPERVYVACGTMGTAVGLLLGFQILELPCKVVAVQVSHPRVASVSAFTELYKNSVRLLHHYDIGHSISAEAPSDQLIFCEDFFGNGYGIPTEAARDAITMMHADDLELDGTYTGKAMSALLAHAHNGELDGQTVLYWHTRNAMTTPIADFDEYPKLGDKFSEYFE